MTSSRQKPPFGIAQIGKSFRNEITPGNFIFRTREFEQMEMEFFVKPGEDEEWHQYWIDERTRWYVDLGIDPDNLRHYEHAQEKLSHYSKRTVDIEYRFRFAGSEWGELEGIANRTDFDLTHALEALRPGPVSYFDQANNERYTPYVIEPAAGLSRSLMTFLVDAYTEDEAPNTKGGVDKRTVLQARPAPGAGQGRGAAAEPQRRPLAQGQGPRRPSCAATGTSTSTTPARSAAATAARTRSARRTASRSTSRPSRTTPSPCASATRWRRSGSASTASRRTSPSVSSAAEAAPRARLARMSSACVPS